MAESNDAGEKPPSQSKHVNVQDVIVVSAGDDGDVWIWKPLQVMQSFVFCRASTYIEDGKRYSANISKLCWKKIMIKIGLQGLLKMNAA